MEQPTPAPSFDPYKAPSGAAIPTEPTAVTSDEKLWAMLGHLAGLLAYVTAVGQFIGPLIVYVFYKDKSKFVAFHALQSLYFQLLILVAWVAVGLLTAVFCFAIILAAPLAIGSLVYNIIAAVKANKGEMYEYWLVGKWARDQVGI